MAVELESSTQTVPKSNATNANLTRSNNTQSLADANRDVVQTIDILLINYITALFWGWAKVRCILQNQ